MADFQTVMAQAARMCNSHKSCASCPIRKNRAASCRVFLFEHPDRFEEIIMKWAEEHSVMTNGEKFREVFGYDMTEKFNASLSVKYWLAEEFREPEEQEEHT